MHSRSTSASRSSLFDDDVPRASKLHNKLNIISKGGAWCGVDGASERRKKRPRKERAKRGKEESGKREEGRGKTGGPGPALCEASVP